jgi:hypothetical protein
MVVVFWILVVTAVPISVYLIRSAFVGFHNGTLSFGRAAMRFVVPLLMLTTVIVGIVKHRFPFTRREIDMTGERR